MTQSTFFGAGVVAFELKGCHLFFTCDNGQRIDIDLSQSRVNSCGRVADRRFEIVFAGTSYVFDESEGMNPSGLTQTQAEDMVGICSGSSPGVVTESDVTELMVCLGEIKEKLEQKQALPTGQIISDPASENCGQPIFMCLLNGVPDGKCYVYTGTPKTLTEIEVSESEINVPGSDAGKTFESEILELIQVQADSPVATVADAIALAEAAGLPDLVCKATGQSTPATADDICAYKVRRLPCGASYLTDPTDASTAVEVGTDDAYFVGGVSINAAEDSYGAVDPARPVAAGADAVAVWCFKLKRELSKADIAAL